MRRYLLLALAALLLLPLGPVIRSQVATADVGTAHPRLLFSAADVGTLRQRAGVPGSVHAAAWARLKEKADRDLIKVNPRLLAAGACLPTNLQGFECPYNLQGELPTYLMELGLAYQISGNPTYGTRVIALLSALGDAGFPYWTQEQDLGIGDLLGGVGLAFDWTYQLMTAAERAKIVGDLTAFQDKLFVRPLFEYTNEASTYAASNWMGVTAGGAGLTLLAIKGEPGAPVGFDSPTGPAIPNTTGEQWPARHYTFDDYLAKAMLQVRTYFRGGFDLTGASHEGHTYAEYGLRSSVPFSVAAKRAGLGDATDGTGLPATHAWGRSGYFDLPLTQPGDGTGIKKLSRWLATEQLPGDGQNYVPLGDSQRDEVGTELQAQLFALDPDDGVAQWFWRRTVGDLGTNYYGKKLPTTAVRDDKCRYPKETASYVTCDIFAIQSEILTILFYRTPAETPEVDPATTGPLTTHSSERGLVDARTGFARGQHETVSTFEAHRNGIAHFQYDVGNFTLYGEGGRWAIDPGFDCVACKDDGVTHLAGYADYHNVVLVDGAQRTQSVDSRYSMVRGVTIDQFQNAPNLSLAHADTRYAYGGYAPSFSAPAAGRDHLFARAPGRPVLLAIADALQRDAAPHVYRWQMLTNNDNVVIPDGTGFTIWHSYKGPMLRGRVAAGGTAATDLAIQLKPLVDPASGDDEGKVFPVLYTETPKQLAMDQLAVLALTPAGAEPAITQTLRVVGGNAIAVQWRGRSDVVVRRLTGASAVTGVVATDGDLAKLTTGLGETVLRRGTRLAAYGVDYVQVTGSAATVTVSGSVITATGPAGNAYRVFAPTPVDQVLVNGAAITSCRDGDYVSFPC